MHTKKVSSQDEVTESNEFSKLDAASSSLISQATNMEEDVEVDQLMNHLKKMESTIRILEEGHEYLFWRLINAQVYLLNILNR